MGPDRDGGQTRHGLCPFLDLNDSRCAAHFTLGRIQEMFGTCVNRYHACATYHRLCREQARSEPSLALGDPSRGLLGHRSAVCRR